MTGPTGSDRSQPVDQVDAGIATVPEAVRRCRPPVTADGPVHYRIEPTTHHGRKAPLIYRRIVAADSLAGRVPITINPIPEGETPNATAPLHYS